jgi:hypothetical protein
VEFLEYFAEHLTLGDARAAVGKSAVVAVAGGVGRQGVNLAWGWRKMGV